MATVGLVLGGGGITGASYHLGSLLALEMATGWHPSQADVIVGTSCGAFTAAMLRGGQLSIDAFLDEAHSRDEVARRLRSRVYRRSTRPKGVVRWVRRGILPGLTRPDLRLVAGSPALYTTEGIVDWVEERLGPLADTWPEEPTVICAFDLAQRRRAPFGTDAAPSASLKHAVAASVAVPMVFEPVQIGGRWYADGGIASGTSADLVLGSPAQLDLVIVVAPMAASESREGARFYEDAFDRAGRAALSQELERVRAEWPGTDIVVFRPDERVLAVTRPNPLSTKAAVPAFLRTLRSLKDELARPDTWQVLHRHLVRTNV
jgi:NTE family protein